LCSDARVTGQLLDNAITWRSCEVEFAALVDLAQDVADLDPGLLDPSLWEAV